MRTRSAAHFNPRGNTDFTIIIMLHYTFPRTHLSIPLLSAASRANSIDVFPMCELINRELTQPHSVLMFCTLNP